MKIHFSFRHPRRHSGQESTCQCRIQKISKLSPRFGKKPWSRKCQSTPVFLPGRLHEQRSLAGYSLWGWIWLSTHALFSFTESGKVKNEHVKSGKVGHNHVTTQKYKSSTFYVVSAIILCLVICKEYIVCLPKPTGGEI